MPSKACLNHKDREAVAQCHQCHKPICKDCLKMSPQGSFCSTECMTKYQDFKARYNEKEPCKKCCPLKALVGLVVAAEIAAYVGHSWLSCNCAILEKIDFLGKFLPHK